MGSSEGGFAPLPTLVARREGVLLTASPQTHGRIAAAKPPLEVVVPEPGVDCIGSG
jgi:hypothetical protein